MSQDIFDAPRPELIARRIVVERRQHEATVNVAEAPLTWLLHHGRISTEQWAAGARLFRDFEAGRLRQRVTVDLSKPPSSRGTRGSGGEQERAVVARQRWGAAMTAVGPGLAGLLCDVVCFERPLRACEVARVWPRGSAGVVLELALDRLVLHYGVARPKMRAWQATEPAQEGERETAAAEGAS